MTNFEIGDKVEILGIQNNYNYIGEILTVIDLGTQNGKFVGVESPDGIRVGYLNRRLKLVCKKNKPKLEENEMKSNDINKNVAAVFGDVPGNDLLLVDKHFDSDMMERILMDKHKTAILKACKDAEAEAVRAEKAKK